MFSLSAISLLLTYSLATPQYNLNPSVYSPPVARINVISISDGTVLFLQKFYDVPPASIERAIRLAFCTPSPIITNGLNIYVLDTPFNHILFDARAFNTSEFFEIGILGQLASALRTCNVPEFNLRVLTLQSSQTVIQGILDVSPSQMVLWHIQMLESTLQEYSMNSGQKNKTRTVS